MQLIGQTIHHKAFGSGVVTERMDNILTICFSQGEKRFLYPDAFSDHLTLGDTALQREIRGILRKKEKAKEAKRQAVQDEQERVYRLRNLKITPTSQAVFDVKPEDRDSVFSAWTISTGRYLGGPSKGQPRLPDRLKPNSLCLLTECKKGSPEQERRIVGAFMVKEDFLGSLCQDGVIEGHPLYRMALEPEEQLLLWPYFGAEPPTRRWGNIAFQYASNETVQRILFDMKQALSDPEQQELGDSFYRYFCRMNRLQSKQADG